MKSLTLKAYQSEDTKKWTDILLTFLFLCDMVLFLISRKLDKKRYEQIKTI